MTKTNPSKTPSNLHPGSFLLGACTATILLLMLSLIVDSGDSACPPASEVCAAEAQKKADELEHQRQALVETAPAFERLKAQQETTPPKAEPSSTPNTTWIDISDPTGEVGEWGNKTTGPWLKVVKGRPGSKTPFNVSYKSADGKLEGGCGLELPSYAFCKTHDETNPYPNPPNTLRPAFLVLEKDAVPSSSGAPVTHLRATLKDEKGHNVFVITAAKQ